MFETERSRYTAITMLATPIAFIIGASLYEIITGRYFIQYFEAAAGMGMILIAADFFFYVRRTGKTWLMQQMGYRDEGEPNLLEIPPKPH